MNDIQEWEELENMDKRTKEYKTKFKEYCFKYIDNGESVKNE